MCIFSPSERRDIELDPRTEEESVAYLDVVFVVEEGRRIHAEVVWDESEEPQSGSRLNLAGFLNGCAWSHPYAAASFLLFHAN